MPIDPSTGLWVPSPPPGLGYGGLAYGFSPYGASVLPREPIAPGSGYGGAPYGTSSYGSGTLPRGPYPPGGGYGGAPYGTGPYGSADIFNPRVTSVSSLDGFRVEVFFSEEMKDDAALVDAASYTFTPTIGAAVTATSVVQGTAGSFGGYTSVIVTHSGTTLGGTYTLAVSGPVDLSDNPMEPAPGNQAVFLSLGSAPTYTVTPQDGDTLRLQFSHDMLPEADFSPGIETTSAYTFTTTYPVPITVGSVVHPVSGDASIVDLEVVGQTSTSYGLEISSATAIDYDGDILPDAATTFTGTEVGTGTSSAGVQGLLLTKALGDSYGWGFADTSSKITASSSYRMDFVFNASLAVYAPSLFDATLGVLLISDGGVEVTITIERVAGQDVLSITSGAYSGQVPATWSTGESTITLVRNQKADHFAILFNGVALVSVATASFTGGPSISAGAQFTLGTSYAVTQFPILSLDFTSSATVFSAAWNFLHGVTSSFTGSSASARDTLLTERGPLVKGWGDATPATKDDVVVRVNGTAVTIEDVNPYIGKITTETPIPMVPPGTITVEVDYKWFPAPALPLAGLNTEGLVLNKWDLPNGHNNPPASPLPAGHLGAPNLGRFPMGIVIGPLERQKPIYVGHRYIGFEREYSALLNSPTTLILNQDPHRVAKLDMERTPEGVTVAYRGGESDPTQGEPPWLLEGTDNGSGDDIAGTYTVVDNSTTTAAVYSRREDFSFPSAVTIAGRVQADSWTSDGVFTGMGFGLHDNHRLFLGGLLEVNGVKHVAMLENADRPHEVESWELGFGVVISISNATTFTANTADLPANLEATNRFQVLTGSQAGIYTIATIVHQSDGTTTVTLAASTPFPADPTKWGNNAPTVYFEVLWDQNLTTYRMVVDIEAGTAELYLGGELAGLALSLQIAPAYPAQTALLLTTSDQGQVFFGSLSVLAQSTATWAFYQYGVAPNQTTFHSRGIVVAAEMNDLPEDDPNHEWYYTTSFGYSEIDSSGDTMLLKSLSGAASPNLTFGYGRIEPFLNETISIDVDATFRVESGTSSAGDAMILVRDGVREVRLATILYEEGLSPVYRKLLAQLSVSLSGLETPEDAGWTASTANTVTPSVRGQTLTLTQQTGDSGTWAKDFDGGTPNDGGRIFEARFAVVSATAGTDNSIGPAFGGYVGFAPNSRFIHVHFKTGPERIVLNSTGPGDPAVAEFNTTWSDGELHNYRVIVDDTFATLSVVADDVVLGTAVLTDFTIISGSGAFMGSAGTDVVSVVEWDGFSAIVTPPPQAKRTLGVLRGENLDPTDIDSWELPRTDSSTEANSTASAVIEEMDWTQYMQVRVHRNPAWGVTVYRPDLPPPPYFDGEFSTEDTEPSAGWINVEYRNLPRVPDTFGSVRFGALDPIAITQQRWREVRYRIYQYSSEDFIAPHHMVLNQFNVLTSGELGTDVTVETVVVESLSSTLVSLKPAHMYADRVFTVVAEGQVIPSSEWEFNPESQALTLSRALNSEHEPVTVSFAPGKPVTTTYLQAQPLADSRVALNEGTPPFPKSRQADEVREVVFGSQINDPSDLLNGDPDFILNDPYRSVGFSDEPGTLYEEMEFFEVDDGGITGLITSICDGPAPESGLIGIGFDGTDYSEQAAQTETGLISDGPFDQHNILHVSGGMADGSFYDGGHIGGGAMTQAMGILYPTAPSTDAPGEGAAGRRTLWHITLDSVTINDTPTDQDLEEDLSMSGTEDNVPPSEAGDAESNPDGTPGAQSNGAAAGLLSDGAGLYSRLGPWGGLSSLTPDSLLAGDPNTTGFILSGGSALGSPSETPLSIEAAN